jgi:NADPH:quinone reductase
VQVRGAGIERPELMEAGRKAVLKMVDEGAVQPAIARRYRIEDYAEAMHMAFEGKEAGRVILVMD